MSRHQEDHPPDMTPEERYACIVRNLKSVSDKPALEKLLRERQEETISIYWGTAPTGRIHIGYFVPMMKIADFLNAGCKVIILIADIHAQLDSTNGSGALVDHRAEYYEALVKAMLKSISAPIDKLEFVKGTGFQLEKQYTLDAYKLSTKVTVDEALEAGADVVKKGEKSPKLSALIYPGLQALDEVYLKVDAQFGGEDQSKIFEYAKKALPRIGYDHKTIYLINPMVPGLHGKKMSSSGSAEDKIDVLDSADAVNRKLQSASCEPGQVEGNSVLLFCKHVLFPLTPQGFTVKRDEQRGGDLLFKKYSEMEQAYKAQAINPQELLNATGKYLHELMEPVRQQFESEKLQVLVATAYPPH